ncbi:DNA internalization-related competence protein ComEC/Rec2 [Legionella longbeachae]|uniref:Putative DNA uptake/competence proteins n=1 Tax=Legionella longbeachae serogroup 1 (strain NSW150) TaxID=661367 RepID=D3HKP4_LEGLN|nr:DNA internalization-related competence protein ComEC/Rec2 [Legionella longbeachae]VEE03526.1 DNA uptake/competence proteins [Legionella oakridgensis]ARB93585.1 DNA internalization-related competence protein ComEC/Rec2 [Legionella longbeachae]ARM33277.1 DNA internalization-related competence protein ComEC/Rec2 [Legionella longbeachae]EEZ93862.1 DNA internalization-related competence protein ComEC/Rec2 [Legionella longbeachae D-4968]QIN33230.1 DNA internalization-related competence protein Co
MEIFCFFIGILYRYTLHGLLPILILFIFFIIPRYANILFFLLGIFIATVHQSQNLPKGLPDVEVIPQVSIQGTIASIPLQSPSKTLFLLALEQYDNHPAQGIIQLSWYNKAPKIHVGQRWKFKVKLKKPRNYLNPGSMDYVRSLATRHILWTGYIHSRGNKQLPKVPSSFNWLELREQLSEQLGLLAPDQKTAGIVEALALNITTHIDQKSWDLFRRTGTTHLFGISGEHIALISGIIYWLLRWIWTRSSRLCLRIPAPHIASMGGLLAASGYAFLAGFAPPVQRALIGCFFYTLYSLGYQRFTPWQVWRYALCGVLLIEPHAVFMQGFYFSFLAVACLLLTQQRWRLKGYKASLALQLSCLIGLMPLTLYWYAYGSINGFIANLFAIPLVGLLIVPLSLMTMTVSSLSIAKILMKAVSLLITLLFKGLSLSEYLAALNINCPIYSIELALVLIGALLMWVLLPTKPFQWIAMLWLLLPFFPPRTIIQAGEAKIDVLDVGQGLAVAIRTQHHVLLYDTGDRFFQGNDLGKMVILPYLNTLGIKKIDTIVVSHPDKDHLGGLKSLEKEIPVERLLVNEPHFYHRGLKCHDYPPWQWDGVSFRFLPIKIPLRGKNNSSCILQIETHAGRMLLAGDIEKIAEDYLVQTYGNILESDVLLVPHHGSKTSSSYRFLLEVAPLYAIASLGFDNRFHFPHDKTLANMKKLNIPFYRTDTCGMVQITLPAQGALTHPTCFSGQRLQPV